MNKGDLIVLTLHDPREQIWGVLRKISVAGIYVRGIDIRNFEEWSQQIALAKDPQLGPATHFFPMLRIERLSADEPVGAVPSMQQRFSEIVGQDAINFF